MQRAFWGKSKHKGLLGQTKWVNDLAMLGEKENDMTTIHVAWTMYGINLFAKVQVIIHYQPWDSACVMQLQRASCFRVPSLWGLFTDQGRKRISVVGQLRHGIYILTLIIFCACWIRSICDMLSILYQNCYTSYY